jgi:hypothetical protein
MFMLLFLAVVLPSKNEYVRGRFAVFIVSDVFYIFDKIIWTFESGMLAS